MVIGLDGKDFLEWTSFNELFSLHLGRLMERFRGCSSSEGMNVGDIDSLKPNAQLDVLDEMELLALRLLVEIEMLGTGDNFNTLSNPFHDFDPLFFNNDSMEKSETNFIRPS